MAVHAKGVLGGPVRPLRVGSRVRGQRVGTVSRVLSCGGARVEQVTLNELLMYIVSWTRVGRLRSCFTPTSQAGKPRPREGR